MRMLIAIATMVVLAGSAAFACDKTTAHLRLHQDTAASSERTAPPADEAS